tara:strand:- start:394 stop:951 length:558 start_codon:yes stop_codon:yes gene_type:complete
MTRLPPINQDKLTKSQIKFLEAIQNGPRGKIPMTGPFGVWLRAGSTGDVIQKLGASLRYDTILDETLKELAICVVGSHYKAKFEFAYHAELAKKTGISDKILEDLRHNKTPSFNDSRLKLIYQITTQLLDKHSLSDDIYREGINEFKEQGMIELVSLVGYYCLVSLTLNAFEIPIDDGMNDPFND